MIEKLFKAMAGISQLKHELVCSQMNESLLLWIANFTNPLFPVINSSTNLMENREISKLDDGSAEFNGEETDVERTISGLVCISCTCR